MKRLIKLTAIIMIISVFTVGCGNDDIGATFSTDSVTSVEPLAPSDTVSSSSKGETTVSSQNDSSSLTVESSSSTAVSSDTSSKEEVEVPEWKLHPEDFKLIALTYDDAPAFNKAGHNPTTGIIDTLNNYEGAGTLFVVGSTLNTNGENLLEYAVSKGFEIGNHTYSHRSVSTDSLGKQWTAEENKQDIEKCQNLIKSKLGITVKSFRPAGAHTNEALYAAAAELGLPPIVGNRNVAVSDWNSATTTEQITERVLQNAYDGAIILLHSTNSKTAEATESICYQLYEEGYRFCTVEELFRFKGKDFSDVPDNATVYGIDPVTNEIQTTKNY